MSKISNTLLERVVIGSCIAVMAWSGLFLYYLASVS